MVNDTEDYTEAVIIKGSDGTSLVTLLTDSDGRLVGVLKGDYEGGLETIKLDSEHRMLARTLSSVSNIITERYYQQATSNHALVNIAAVPAGKYWCINNVIAWNGTRLTPWIYFLKFHIDISYYFDLFKDIPMDFVCRWNGELWLDEGDFLRFYFYGSLIGDWINVYVHGKEISKV